MNYAALQISVTNWAKLQVKPSKLQRSSKQSTTTVISHNIVLGQTPSPVNPNEKDLPRQIRTKLAQLKSGWCRIHNHYKLRLNTDLDDTSSLCEVGPYDTRLLFECPNNLTSLNVTSLRTMPKTDSIFLERRKVI